MPSRKVSWMFKIWISRNLASLLFFCPLRKGNGEEKERLGCYVVLDYSARSAQPGLGLVLLIGIRLDSKEEKKSSLVDAY
jgi:hypothetical protein